jgi:hypothetical protein
MSSPADQANNAMNALPSPPGSPRFSAPAPRITTRYPNLEALNLSGAQDWSNEDTEEEHYEDTEEDYSDYEEPQHETPPYREPMTLTEARDAALRLAQNKHHGELWFFLTSRDGSQLLNDKTVRTKTLKSVEMYLASVKEGRTTATPEEHLAASQLRYNIGVMNEFEQNYVRSGPFVFKKGTPHLRR